MENNEVLNQRQLEALIRVTKDVFQTTKELHSESSQEKINIFLGELILSKSFYQYVLEKPIADLADQIASDRDICDYVLSVTTAISMWISTSNYGSDAVIETLARSFELAQSHYGELTILPSAIYNSIHLQADWVTDLFKQNMWLVAIFLYHLSFTRS